MRRENVAEELNVRLKNSIPPRVGWSSRTPRRRLLCRLAISLSAAGYGFRSAGPRVIGYFGDGRVECVRRPAYARSQPCRRGNGRDQVPHPPVQSVVFLLQSVDIKGRRW